MPITSIITQPSADSFLATYRPVTLRVIATKTDASAVPPVVYCDIYFNDVFYKTLSRSMYSKLNVGNSEWEFDIQDAGQEILSFFLGSIYATEIVEATPLVAKVQCKFRSSGHDANGFITPEGTAPVQGTDSTPPIAGTGTSSNEFYIVNATLQHRDTQSLPNHLFYFKHRTWTSAAFPLTHRPDTYRIGANQADIFPIIYTGLGGFAKIRLRYKFCGQSTFHQEDMEIDGGTGTIPSCTALISDPFYSSTGSGGYQITWSLISGSPVKYLVSSPGWNSDLPVEALDTFVLIGDLAPGDHVFTVRPVCMIGGETYIGMAKTVTISVEEPPAACVPAGWSGSVSLPDGQVGEAYAYSFDLTGTAPFMISAISKPSWMSIILSGSTISFSGTPDVAGESISVFFIVSNCFDGTPDQSNFSDTITVEEAAVPEPFPVEGRFAEYEEFVCGAGLGTYYIASPSTAIEPGVTVYFDAGLTLPLGSGFFADHGGEVFSISSGVIGSSTGLIC